MANDPNDLIDPAAIFLRENYAKDEARRAAELPSPEHHFRIAEGLSNDDEDDGVTARLPAAATVAIGITLLILIGIGGGGLVVLAKGIWP
jgi:hypothetical protein